jgi:hypothetical protein
MEGWAGGVRRSTGAGGVDTFSYYSVEDGWVFANIILPCLGAPTNQTLYKMFWDAVNCEKCSTVCAQRVTADISEKGKTPMEASEKPGAGWNSTRFANKELGS